MAEFRTPSPVSTSFSTDPTSTSTIVPLRAGAGPTGAQESHGEAEAERLAVEALAALGVSSERKDLEGMRKGDRPKVLVAALLGKRTAVANDWIAKRLIMGHHRSVSRLEVAASKNAKHESELKKLMRRVKYATCPYPQEIPTRKQAPPIRTTSPTAALATSARASRTKSACTPSAAAMSWAITP